MAAFWAIVAIIGILIGIVGCVLPLLPGLPIAFLAVLLYAWYDGFIHIGTGYLLTVGILSFLTIVTDYLMTALGSKMFGSSNKSAIGSVVGSIIGIFIWPPFGIIVFGFVGALVVEWYLSQDLTKALKAAVGATIGFFSGTVFKVILGIIILVSFIIKITVS